MTRRNSLVVLLSFILSLLLIGCGPSDEVFDVIESEVSSTPFVLAVVPDAQMMTQYEPGKFINQMRWIKNNVSNLNIKFVSQVGDITNTNSTSEWNTARTAMYQLDGVVPYAIAPGNHDSGSGEYNTFNSYFPYSKYAGLPWYGGAYQNRNHNSYELFSASGLNFVIIHLAYKPDSNERAWASSVLNSNRSRRAIISTHSCLNTSGSLTAEGSAIWSMAKSHDNVFMVICGHMWGQKYKTFTNNFGHKVHFLLTDYQSETQVGKFRYYKFKPAENAITAYTYGVETARYYTNSGSQFTFSYSMGGDPPPPGGNNTLLSDQVLGSSGYLESSDAAYRFYVQSDGNLVLRDWPGSTVRWASGTDGSGGVKLIMQSDGNLVLYTSANRAVWSSRTVGSDAERLTLSENGDLGIYTNTGSVVWSKPN